MYEFAFKFWSIATLVIIILTIGMGTYYGYASADAITKTAGISAITVSSVLAAAGVGLMGYIVVSELQHRI